MNCKEYVRVRVECKVSEKFNGAIGIIGVKLHFYYGHVSYFIILYQLVPLITHDVMKQKRYEDVKFAACVWFPAHSFTKTFRKFTNILTKIAVI